MVGAAALTPVAEGPRGAGSEGEDSLVRMVTEGITTLYVDGTLRHVSPAPAGGSVGAAHFWKVNRVFSIANALVTTADDGLLWQCALRELPRSQGPFAYLKLQVFSGQTRDDKLRDFNALPAETARVVCSKTQCLETA
jgi:hypothetical protein